MAIDWTADRPLPESAERDIRNLAAHADSLAKLLKSTADQKPGFSPASVFREASKEMAISYSEVYRIFSAIENLSILSRELGSFEQMASLLSKRLKKEVFDAFNEKKEIINEILNTYRQDHPTAISIKAEKLSILYENVYQEAEVITDVRPVFNTDGTEVFEMLIAHKLVITFYSVTSGVERIHLAMDAADALRLRRACDRAVLKAATLKGVLRGKGWTVTALNERDEIA